MLAKVTGLHTSDGGVPKLPVDVLEITTNGCIGDSQNDLKHHGGVEKAVCIFPSGLVSRKENNIVRDLEWKRTFVLLGKKYNRSVIPIYIEGRLSNFFYRLANFRKKIGIKVNIEMLYLAHEMFKQKGKKITFKIGKPINLNELSKQNPKLNDKKLANLIYNKLYELE